MKAKKIDKLKKYQLRNKLKQLFRKANLEPCKILQTHLSNLNLKINNFFEGEVYQSKLLNNSLRFLYSNHNDQEEIKRKKITNFNKENQIDFSIEKDYLIKLILDNLSNEEIKTISEDIDFFITDNNLKESLGLFSDQHKLYQTLIFEEKTGKVENEDDRIKRILKNRKNYLVNKNNKENIKNFNFDFSKKENENLMKLKEKIILQKKIYQRKKFLSNNHSNVINNIIATSQREINKSNKFISRNNFQRKKLMETLKIYKSNPNSTSKSYKKIKSKVFFNKTNNITSFSLDNTLCSKKIYKEKNKKFKLQKLKRNLLEKESLDFLNLYTNKIRNIFQNKTLSPSLPKIKRKITFNETKRIINNN